MLPGFLEFLGSRSTFMLDFVFLAMFGILPLLGWSIYLVKVKQNYSLHKTMQIVLGLTLLLAVVLFEVDMRLFGWEHLAKPSPYYETYLFPALYIHLFFAIPTLLLWIFVIVQGLRKFPSPPIPNEYSPVHKKTAWAATVGMVCTAVTGWIFYYMAFVA